MQVSFSTPHPPGAGLMLGITGVGEHAMAEAAAQESACAAAVRVLHEEHNYIVLDYSLFRVWECKERFTAFVEKLQNGRGALASVLSQSVEVFHCIRSTFQFFGKKISSLRSSGDGGSIARSAAACAAQLEMIYAQAIEGHTARAEQFDEINDPGDLSSLLVAAGFHVPTNEADHVKLSGALEAILSSVAAGLGYQDPVFEMRTQDIRFKCYINFLSSGVGQGRTFTGFGKVCFNALAARQTALYNCLLAFSVNYDVVISDPNRNAYLFSKERVDEIGSDLVLLGDLGTATCSSIQDTIRIVHELIRAYYSSFSTDRVGQILLQKLQSLSSRLAAFLSTIDHLVRPLNEEAFVARLPY